MPCYYTGSAEGDARLAAKEDREELGKKIAQLTEWLCALCMVAELNKWPLPHGLAAWWKKHKVLDKKRKRSRAPQEKP